MKNIIAWKCVGVKNGEYKHRNQLKAWQINNRN